MDITIDGQHVEVGKDATVLAAARKLGIDIPTLCYLEGYEPNTSCMACLVRINGKMVPSCATKAVEGMVVESELEDIQEARRMALELLLSDHLGDCIAPCHNACPAQMDIPRMIRQIEAGDLRGALETIKSMIPLPGIIGRICPAPCENGCRRGGFDGPAAIALLERHVADVDMASGSPYLPDRKSRTGKRVAIVGAGTTGLSAAYYLLQAGHDCTLIEQCARPGGTLREEFTDDLPEEVIEAEAEIIHSLGAVFDMEVRLGEDVLLSNLREDYDAVLLAVGQTEERDVVSWGLEAGKHGVHVDRDSLATSTIGVFAGGNAIRRSSRLKVRSVADGRSAAVSIGQFLSGNPLAVDRKRFSVHLGKLDPLDLEMMVEEASDSPRVVPEGGAGVGLTFQEALTEAQRCLGCDCGAATSCRLRHYSQAYSADAHAYRGERRTLEAPQQFPQIEQAPQINHGVRFDPGKCITCGLCVQIAGEAEHQLGLTQIGRGFNVRVGVPFDGSIQAGLAETAARCIAACPTGAMVSTRR